MTQTTDTIERAALVCSVSVKESNVGRFTEARSCKGKVVIRLGEKCFCTRHRVYVDQYLAAGGDRAKVTEVKPSRSTRVV